MKAYPAPLAIPLPSYQMGMDSSGGRNVIPPGPSSVGPPLSILHHGDPRRQSTKSHHSAAASAHQQSQHQHGGGHHHHHHGGHVHHNHNHQFESSEDTSDTCLDDHGAGDALFLRASNRRATGKRSKSGFWSRSNKGSSAKEDSSVAKDSGIGTRDGEGKVAKCGCGSNLNRELTGDNDSTWYVWFSHLD